MTDDEIMSLIKRRRLQIMVHSYLYEVENEALIDDYTWDKWAKELAVLQNDNPKLSKQVKEYSKLFRDWTGDTASGLQYDNQTIGRANMLLRLSKNRVMPVS